MVFLGKTLLGGDSAPGTPLTLDEKKETERKLTMLTADPINAVFEDSEFKMFKTKQFERAFPANQPLDATGRGFDMPPVVRDVEPFKPTLRRDDLSFAGSVGEDGRNRPADVIKVKKALANTGLFDFDVTGEKSTDAGPMLRDAMKAFQRLNGIKANGCIKPNCPTHKALNALFFPEGGTNSKAGAGSRRHGGPSNWYSGNGFNMIPTLSRWNADRWVAITARTPPPKRRRKSASCFETRITPAMNTSPEASDAAALLRGLFDAAVASADPAIRLPPHLPPAAKFSAKGRIIVLGAGKAAASMARAVEDHYAGSGVADALEGLVVTRYGHAVPCRHIEVVEAAHPLPDEAGVAAARRVLALAAGAGEDDFVLCLISGGGSALLTLPADGLSLADKLAVNKALLASGAAISEINAVRKHLSAIKGGRLAAAAAPARLLSLLISDVPGDDPAIVASGPTAADPTRYSDAIAVLEKYGIGGPPEIIAHLRRGREETPKPGDKLLARAEAAIVARPADMLAAAAQAARAASVNPIVLGDAVEGEAREVAREQGSRAIEAASGPLPAVLLSGGELTVTIRGGGRGGPNAEYLLALAVALDGHPGIHALACDTDGGDGTEGNAGAIIGPDTLTRARARGVDPARALADNDSYGFFAALDDLVVTGPTLTNVNDFRAILIANSDAPAARPG